MIKSLKRVVGREHFYNSALFEQLKVDDVIVIEIERHGVRLVTQVLQKWKEDQKKYKEKGVNLQMLLKQMAKFNLLPTPLAQEGGKLTGNKKENQMSKTKLVRQNIGTNSQLSPQFVMEMMGFPTDWTELPFLNGEENQLKQEVTQ